ncbi:MAG: alpha/beta fold hydrolase [Lysobacteraceae bacterium]|nr:MAG: alpha/beta fold hydrolase [Xanthomonadaceae bacterium]
MIAPSSADAPLLYWLPALGVTARSYVAFAYALASRGVAVALHEWRGGGSSDRRAGRHVDWGYRDLLRRDLPAGFGAARDVLGARALLLGGHSLGGQLALLSAALPPYPPRRIVLVASGAPWWRAFPHRHLVRAVLHAAPVIARVRGYFPGRRLGFGGNEARGVISDWARSGRTGRYAVDGIGDLEQALARCRVQVDAWRLADDWLGPAASLDWLLGKLPQAERRVTVLDDAALGTRADHFSWMKEPARLATAIADAIDGP